MDVERYTDEAQLKKAKTKRSVKEYLMVFLATVLYAVTTYRYIIGNGFAPSGFSGILAMIEYAFDLKSGSFTLLLINLPFLIWGWFTLSRDFAIKTTMSVFVMCLCFYLFSVFDPEGKLRFNTTTSITVGAETVVVSDFGKKFFCAIASGVFAGICIAITFKNNGSLGGVDIIVMIIQHKKPHAKVSVLLMLANVVVIVAAFFVFGRNVESICFAVIYILIFSKVSEYILKGVKQALKFEVITGNPDELSAEIIKKLGHSVTVTRGRGMYANTEKYVLICVIRNNQIAEFENILKDFPDTFAFCSSVSEVVGTFFI